MQKNEARFSHDLSRIMISQWHCSILCCNFDPLRQWRIHFYRETFLINPFLINNFCHQNVYLQHIIELWITFCFETFFYFNVIAFIFYQEGCTIQDCVSKDFCSDRTFNVTVLLNVILFPKIYWAHLNTNFLYILLFIFVLFEHQFARVIKTRNYFLTEW